MRIRQAALRLFARKGYEATSIRDIAIEADIKSATLYYYMGTKEDLLIRIMQEELNEIIESAREIISAITQPECQLASLVQLHVIVHGVKQLSTLVVDTEYRALKGDNRLIVSKLRREYELIWRAVLEKGQEDKVFHFNDIKLTAYALLEMCTGVAHWYSPKGPTKIEDIGFNFADMALKLVGARRNEQEISVQQLVLPDPKLFLGDNFHSERSL